MTIEPKPKRMGILSLRTPMRAYGTFKHPEFAVEKGPLLARAGGALAMLAAAPLAALLPLIETGPGTPTDCRAVKRQATKAEQQIKKNSIRKF